MTNPSRYLIATLAAVALVLPVAAQSKQDFGRATAVPDVPNASESYNLSYPGGGAEPTPTAGALDGDDSTYNRLTGAACGTVSGVGTAVFYDTITITNNSLGTASFTAETSDPGAPGVCPSIDTYMTAYSTFVPATPAANCLATDDDSGAGFCSRLTFTLARGASATLVVTSFDNGATFPYQVNFTGTTGPAKGDFNSDGLPDMVFRSNVNGAQNKVWFMDGVTRTSEAAITPDAASADWKIRGVDDFSGDGLNDLAVWNQTTGALEFWLMNGTTRNGAAVPISGAPTLATNWDLSATNDFNHNGQTDLVWRNFTSQKIVIWTMNGTAKVGNVIPTPDQAVDANWIIVAAADYNNDGNVDFLWYNFTSGKIVTWYMNASVVRTSGQFTTPANAGDANWKVLASSDYSRNYSPGTPPAGSSDIVWRNETSGNQVVWHLDFNSTRVHGQFTNPAANSPALDWTIVGPR